MKYTERQAALAANPRRIERDKKHAAWQAEFARNPIAVLFARGVAHTVKRNPFHELARVAAVMATRKRIRELQDKQWDLIRLGRAQREYERQAQQSRKRGETA